MQARRQPPSRPRFALKPAPARSAQVRSALENPLKSAFLPQQPLHPLSPHWAGVASEKVGQKALALRRHRPELRFEHSRWNPRFPAELRPRPLPCGDFSRGIAARYFCPCLRRQKVLQWWGNYSKTIPCLPSLDTRSDTRPHTLNHTRFSS